MKFCIAVLVFALCLVSCDKDENSIEYIEDQINDARPLTSVDVRTNGGTDLGSSYSGFSSAEAKNGWLILKYGTDPYLFSLSNAAYVFVDKQDHTVIIYY
ncbi:hypothetical protein F9K33_16130 [bacterium]|nr:MAG: hypothetical protein F9K33_16130 [bacterium]